MRILFKILIKKINNLKIKWELSHFDEYTIAEHFRKQGAQIGEGCRIIPTVLAGEPYLVKIGNRVTIANGVRLLTHNGAVWIFRDEFTNIQLYGPIIIEDNCVIGENAIILPNVKIGPNSIVGAGSVVISDIKPNSIALGVPARVLGSIEKFKEKSIKEWKVQIPPDVEIEPEADWWTSKNYAKNREQLKRQLINLFWNKSS